MLREQKPRNGIGRIIVASVLLALPLLESVSITSAFSKEKPETPRVKASLTTVSGNFQCKLSPQERTISFESKDGSSHLRVKLEIPKGVDLSDPILFSCSEQITIIATSRYLVRTIGYSDAVLGKLTVGTLDGVDYFSNVLVWDLEPLGRIKKADFLERVEYLHEDEVAVETVDGRFYRIFLDRPRAPAEGL